MSTILVLDDDRIFRRLVTDALEGRGYRVLQAGRAADGDRLLELENPDLMLVDGLLPDITGVQWIEKVRRAGQRMHILLVTSFWRSLREFEVVARKLGDIQLLRKPVEPEAVADCVDAVLATARRGPEGR
jgi:two-component system, OmpR family, phosphate regulon response regulator PhoB